MRSGHAEPEVLLLFRHQQQDWSFPKGHTEAGEIAEQCMYREIKEETGLDVRLLGEITPLEYITATGVPALVSMYVVTPQNLKQLEKIEHPEDQLAWIPFSHIVDRLTHQNLKTYLRAEQTRIQILFSKERN